MNLGEAKKLIGSVATLDLINGVTVTTKVTDVITEYEVKSAIAGGTDKMEECVPVLVCKDPIEFRIEMGQPTNPNAPVSAQNQPQAHLVPIPYGSPMYDVTSLQLDITHILACLDTPKHYEDAYNQITSGIVTASANTLDVMKAANG